MTFLRLPEKHTSRRLQGNKMQSQQSLQYIIVNRRLESRLLCVLTKVRAVIAAAAVDF